MTTMRIFRYEYYVVYTGIYPRKPEIIEGPFTSEKKAEERITVITNENAALVARGGLFEVWYKKVEIK